MRTMFNTAKVNPTSGVRGVTRNLKTKVTRESINNFVTHYTKPEKSPRLLRMVAPHLMLNETILKMAGLTPFFGDEEADYILKGSIMTHSLVKQIRSNRSLEKMQMISDKDKKSLKNRLECVYEDTKRVPAAWELEGYQLAVYEDLKAAILRDIPDLTDRNVLRTLAAIELLTSKKSNPFVRPSVQYYINGQADKLF